MTGAGGWRVCSAPTADLGAARLERVRALLVASFADRPEGPFGPDDWSHCLGGVHCWVEEDGQVLAHAAVVLRRLLHEGSDDGQVQRVLRCGYVEAVAVRSDRRRSGLGGAVMAGVESLIRGGYELGALGATEQGSPLYRSRGWLAWRGLLGHLTTGGVVPDPSESGKILVLPVDDVHLDLDLDGRLVCGMREGDPW